MINGDGLPKAQVSLRTAEVSELLVTNKKGEQQSLGLFQLRSTWEGMCSYEQLSPQKLGKVIMFNPAASAPFSLGDILKLDPAATPVTIIAATADIWARIAELENGEKPHG